MDILDIDEALKDDSFMFSEDKTHDDVSNILQQWKTNNPEQGFKLNTRTFTRPKRKFAQNLETQFCNFNSSNHAMMTGQHQQNGINMDIGGLVTTMHKNFLQDTSPPPSICSSMDASSMDRMNGSLVTSADFTNVSFLQSTVGLEFNDPTADGTAVSAAAAAAEFYLNEKVFDVGGYTLSDMIRDRKALENLTLSGEGTLIKDSNIAQIDDISFVSKTGSGYSTMDNSTESMDATPVASRTYDGEIFKTFNQTFENYAPPVTTTIATTTCISNRPINTIASMPDDMIGNTSFSLVENSIGMESMQASAASNVMNITIDSIATTVQHQFKLPEINDDCNKTFCQQPAITVENIINLDATICLAQQFNIAGGGADVIANTTFNCNSDDVSPKCGTPEQLEPKNNVQKKVSEQSTPQQGTVIRCRQQYTPSIKSVGMNLSPIIGTPNETINETFDKSAISNEIKGKINCYGEENQNDSKRMLFEDMEMLENVENPTDMFSQTISIAPAASILLPPTSVDEQQVNILLESNDKNEEEFAQMLEKLSRIELNDDQIKMRKSLDTIKRRFVCGGQMASNEKSPPMPEVSEGKEIPQSYIDSSVNNGAGNSINNAGASDRLLSRRSRLYDDVNLSMSAKSTSASFIVQQPTVVQPSFANFVPQNNIESCKTENENNIEFNSISCGNKQKTDEDNTNNDAVYSAGIPRPTLRATKLEKRGDRDRFKTIRIVKRYEDATNGDAPAREFNVPCIDDYELDPNEFHSGGIEECKRISRRHDSLSPSPPPPPPPPSLHIFKNNKCVNNQEQESEEQRNNYATYRKPKEKLFRRNEISQAASAARTSTTNASGAAARDRPERSLSRPRYISGLQKFTVANKAISAGDLEKTITQPQQTIVSNRSQQQHPIAKDLKSPMGIKSKSFHNLASNFGYVSQPPTYTGKGSIGLKKSSTGGNVVADKVNKTNPNRTNQISRMQPVSSIIKQQQQQNNDDAVFKVPSLTSGLRAPSATNTKQRTGLIRPSSGYYSLSIAKPPADTDSDTGRHSPTESMSSASSRGSSNGLRTNLNGMSSGNSVTSGDSNTNINGIENSNSRTNKTKTVITTNIPKPSGLKPPSNIKRSGLPRPASIVRR